MQFDQERSNVSFKTFNFIFYVAVLIMVVLLIMDSCCNQFSGYCFQNTRTIVQPGSLDAEAGVYAMAFDLSGR